jgi:cytochrome c oxidase assembly protein Cox11
MTRLPSVWDEVHKNNVRRNLWLGLVGLAVIAGLGFGGWLYRRETAPVEVHLVASVNNLPFTVETIPPVIEAAPGQMISVTFRIRNNAVQPIAAYGRLYIEPAAAGDQIKVYLTQCGGLNTFQNSYAADYRVLFRVQPAGLTGQQQITLLHVFTPATS